MTSPTVDKLTIAAELYIETRHHMWLHFEKVPKYTRQFPLLPDNDGSNAGGNDSMSIGSESIAFSEDDKLVQRLLGPHISDSE